MPIDNWIAAFFLIQREKRREQDDEQINTNLRKLERKELSQYRVGMVFNLYLAG